MFELGNINAITEWTYKINGHAYTMDVCQPTTEARRANLKAGDRFTVNGEKYEYDGETAVPIESLNGQAEKVRRNREPGQKAKIQKLGERRDRAGLLAMLPKITDPANRRYAQDWLRNM